MESFLPLGGFQLPFQRTLSRLYNDTKKSSDFVKEPIQNAEDPEIKALHRKLRIQKDRLISWGLEWSDPNQSAEIDESLSKAGLSELVGSIMSTIKDILAEAEPLWLSSKRLIGDTGKSADVKKPLVVWDKGRFEDLVRDLTTSIDTLYDLSRTRSAASADRRPRLYKSSSSLEDFKPFESTRMQTPHQIDPRTLTHLRQMQAESMSEQATGTESREIVFMSKQAYSELTHRTGRQPWSPLLLEYAAFDPIYSQTGIMPSMTRFEKLFSGLQKDPQRSPGSWTGLPRLLGYFEDMDNSRLGLLYQFPTTFSPVSFTQNPVSTLCSLSDLLSRPDSEPRLEAKFRLAYNLANTVFDMHARGITHSNLSDDNVTFCNASPSDPAAGTGEVDVRRPLISSFEIFSDTPQTNLVPDRPLLRHPLDPKTTPQSPLSASSKTLDLYSLAMLLLSIGMWTKLENLAPTPTSFAISESILEQLAIRCGTLYMKAVQTCWNAVDMELSKGSSQEETIAKVQLRASRYLEACCILDGVSGLEERIGDDFGEAPESRQSVPVSAPSVSGPPRDSKPIDVKQAARTAKDPMAQLAQSTNKSEMRSPPQSPTLQPTKENLEGKLHGHETARIPDEPELTGETEASKRSADVPTKTKPKLRWYPLVPLAPEVIYQWENVWKAQINQALKHFSRKNINETVEISIGAVGESPETTRPTIIVVCQSVGKVRAILKRKLGMLFDGSAGLGLKVTRGQLVLSRGGRGARRSMAKGDNEHSDEEEDPTPANPGYQERPKNGASIGAWIGDRHLPPVSFGGLVMVDEKLYGMTVHHMLDDPDQDDDDAGYVGPTRSSTAGHWMAGLSYDGASGDSSEEDAASAFSDGDSDDLSETDITSDQEDEDDEDDDNQYKEPGDIPGIEPGCGEGYIVTQPARDDIAEGFYPDEETADEDHLDSFSLGEVFVSSGIRRRHEGGLVHEIDWALFELNEERCPGENTIPCIPPAASQSPHGRGVRSSAAGTTEHRPTAIVPARGLGGLEVQCMARTSGLQSGMILPTTSLVKLKGRQTFSDGYQVRPTRSGHGGPSSSTTGKSGSQRLLGVPGDSGAWVVDRRHGRLCGHVLAWSDRKQVAYISPMEVLLLDIAETLEATEIRLPGGEPIVSLRECTDPPRETRVRRSDDSVREDDNSDADNMDNADDEADDDQPAARPKQSGLGLRPAPSPQSSQTQWDIESAFDEKAAGLDLEKGLKKLSISTKEVGVKTR